MSAHASVTVDVVTIDPAPLRVNHPDGDVSLRIVDGDVQVWLHGTVDQLIEFGNNIAELAITAKRRA